MHPSRNLVLRYGSGKITEQLAPSRLLRLFGNEVPGEYIAMMVCKYEAFVVQLPITLVQGNFKYLGKFSMRGGLDPLIS